MGLRLPALRYDRARSYLVVRTAHLERAHDFVPASILYGGRRYDFDESAAAGLDLHRCSLPGLALRLLLDPLAALEVNEPLQLSGLPRAATAVLAVRLGDWLRRRRTVIGSYAIENLDPFRPRPDRLRSRVRRFGEAALSRLVSAQLDRIAYGTDGAARLYAERLGTTLGQTSSQIFPALPAPCDCHLEDGPVGEGQVESKDPDLVLFLGALDRRKGVLALLAAWPAVLARRPSARLMLVGLGELEGEVRTRMASLEHTELVVDPPRTEIHRWLRRTTTVVLFSQPSPRWREQVGLPIVEGLAHGTKVVASDQTGLAQWLSDHGHRVLPPDADAEALGAAVAASLADRTPDLDDLPEIDGRRAADDWLLDAQRPSGADRALEPVTR